MFLLANQRLATPAARLLLIAAAFLAMIVAAPPAQAQIIKPQGMTLPGFLFSASERRAREACAQERPECRQTIRAQMEHEMAISLTLPWIGLAVAVLAVLIWLREQDRRKQKARLAARARHDPVKFSKLDREKSERMKEEADEDL